MSHFDRRTITAVVVANMIGTGVFTSLGFQLLDIRSGFVIMMLWLVGGLAALCGALSYAELGAAMPRSGGEYNFLGRILHPAAGFVSGWISASIGFTAPVALAALTFAAYAGASIPLLAEPSAQKLLAIALILLLAAVHSRSHRSSGRLQNAFTLLKVAIIIGFCVAALLFAEPLQSLPLHPVAGDSSLLFSGAFAVSLIYVSYAYTGWNAATYLSGEMIAPQRNLPIVLLGGTAIVTVLYVALNYVFLKVAPIALMSGQIEVGAIAARSAFGELGGRIVGAVLALLLISTASSMTVAGPRVLQVIGEDFAALSALGRQNADGIPHVAVWFQSLTAAAFVLLSGFQSILLFTGFTLALNSFATVAALFVLRHRRPDLPRPYRVPLYPLTPLIFLGVTGWTLVYVLRSQPAEGLFGLSLVLAGLLFYRLVLGSRQG
jgi:APA family basic amino acid/polyamine antiporter